MTIKVNNKPINVTMFPDGTSQVWKLSDDLYKEICSSEDVEVRWDFSHEHEFIHLAQLKHLLTLTNTNASLYLSYLPYGRQDKPVSNDATFGLMTFAKLLDGLEFTCVIILDPHSSIAIKHIKNSEIEYPDDQLAFAMKATSSKIFFYPDEGAREKYSNVYNHPYFYARKRRNQLTGEITSYELVGDPRDTKDMVIMIVDDICDGGATFIKLTELLIEAGAKDVNLFVTHGIFSKGTRILFDAGIKRIFTKDGEVGPRIDTKYI